jgi:hypothetical protein
MCGTQTKVSCHHQRKRSSTYKKGNIRAFQKPSAEKEVFPR